MIVSTVELCLGLMTYFHSRVVQFKGMLVSKVEWCVFGMTVFIVEVCLVGMIVSIIEWCLGVMIVSTVG